MTSATSITRKTMDPETYDVHCADHGLLRSGIASAHAVNLERKHLREVHGDLTPDHFDISGMAGDVVDWIDTGDASRALTALRLWMTLTGLAEDAAVEYARTVAGAERPTYAFPPAL